MVRIPRGAPPQKAQLHQAAEQAPRVTTDLTNRSVAAVFGHPGHAGVTPPRASRFAGQDLRVTADERASLVKGDLESFWSARVDRDPVARVGMALWATPEQLKAAIASTGEEAWEPDMNLASALGLILRLDLPKDFPFPPHGPEQLFRYWSYMGTATANRVVDKAIHAHVLPKDASEDQKKSLLHNVGLALARAHVQAVTQDAALNTGDHPGLLSLAQVASYHHQVFRSFRLPPDTYGGTPLPLVPNWLELRVAGGLYAPDADPK